jgi:hypothetical protein
VVSPVSDGCLHCVPCQLARLERAQLRIERTLSRMETAMANELEQLNTIKSKLADVHTDVKAKLEQVRAEVGPEGQAALDEISAALDSFDAEIGDADGSDTPAAPADPNAVPGQDTGDVPAADTTVNDNAVSPDNATDENGTPLDADGNPRV